MRESLTRLLVVLAFGAGACRRTPDLQQAATPLYCPHGSWDSLTVSEHGIDRFAFDSSIASMTRLCPAAHDSVLGGYEGEAVATAFRFPGAALLAYHDSGAGYENRPSDLWVVTGDSVRLPGGLRLRSSWAAFRSAYGERVAVAGDAPNNDTEWVSFAFCSLPHLSFDFPILADSALADSGRGDISPERVPPTPRIRSVALERNPEDWLLRHCRH